MDFWWNDNVLAETSKGTCIIYTRGHVEERVWDLLHVSAAELCTYCYGAI